MRRISRQAGGCAGAQPPVDPDGRSLLLFRSRSVVDQTEVLFSWLPRDALVPAADPVDDAAAAAFVAALPSLIAGWAVGGFYLSLGPSLVL